MTSAFSGLRYDRSRQSHSPTTPYPNKSDRILDKPRVDGGGEYGQLARTGIMDACLRKLDDVQLCRIKTVYWREFLKIFQKNTEELSAGHAKLTRHFQDRLHHAAFQRLTEALGEGLLGIVAQRDHVGDAQQAAHPEIHHR